MTGRAQLACWLADSGTTQTAFAERLGVTRAAVSHWIRGRAVPGLAHACQIADLTGIPVTAWYRDRAKKRRGRLTGGR